MGKKRSMKRKLSYREEDRESDGYENSDSDQQARGVFVVERIVDKQVIEGTAFYLVKWKGWRESANTWEPIENLEGCIDLVEAFDEGHAQRKKLVPKRRRISGPKRRVRKNSFSDRDEDEDEDEMVESTKKNMKFFGVSKHWPSEREPISVEGVITVNGVLTYVVKKSTRTGSTDTLDRTNTVLVHADSFRKLYPQLVIAFYERRILFCEDDRDDMDKANVAAQMSLLQKNKASNIGTDIIDRVKLHRQKKRQIAMK